MKGNCNIHYYMDDAKKVQRDVDLFETFEITTNEEEKREYLLSQYFLLFFSLEGSRDDLVVANVSKKVVHVKTTKQLRIYGSQS